MITLFSHRIKIIKGLFLLIFLIFAGRLFELQIIKGAEYADIATTQQQKKSIIPANRGKILVKKNRYTDDLIPLATNNTLQMLFIDPLVLAYPAYNPKNPLETQERGNPSLAAQLLASTLIHAHCEEIDGCIIETDPANWSDTEKHAIEIYTTELEKLFIKLEKDRVILMTDISESRGQEILSLNFPGLSVRNKNLVANPLFISDPVLVAEKLAPLLGMDPLRLEYLLQKTYYRYKEITHKIVPEVSEKIWELKTDPRYRDILRGVQLQDEYWRFYPEKNLGAQVIGFVDSAGNGQYGIEGRFNQELKGKAGVISGATNTRGQRIFSGNLGIERAEDGANVVLSLDRFIQGRVEKILNEDLERFQADFGQVIVIEPKTGKILAMTNAPGFDPNNFGEVFSRYEVSEEQELLDREDETFNRRIPTIQDKNVLYRYFNFWGPEVFRNKIVTDEYEPGSVIKALTLAVALNSKEIEPLTTYNDNGPVEVDEFKIRNSDNVYSGKTTMVEVLSRSLNTGIAFVTQKMGNRLLYESLKKFGFSEYTDIELDAEARGQLEYWEDWEMSELVTRGFGQGFTASPLQVALSFAAIANGGYLMKPLLVEEIHYSNDTKETFAPERIRRVISEDTARTIRSMLLSAVSSGDGTGRGARVYGYSVLGKTGTSQTYRNGQAQTGLGTTIASFVGMAPVDDPQFVILVKYDHPKASQWGSETAAVTFRKVADFLFDYLKIPPDR